MKTIELELPLGDPEAGPVAEERIAHLVAAAGGNQDVARRLAQSFPTLAAIYTAPQRELDRVIGPVAAARLRWFLDAPLRTALVSLPRSVPRRAA